MVLHHGRTASSSPDPRRGVEGVAAAANGEALAKTSRIFLRPAVALDAVRCATGEGEGRALILRGKGYVLIVRCANIRIAR